MKRKPIIHCLLAGVSLLTASVYATPAKPSVVFITLDDLSRESVGIHGCKVPDITPNMDRIAESGVRFEHFHVQSGNCTPSRNIIMSGMYQQHNRVFSLGKEGAGNHKLLNTMPSVFQAAGYHTGIIGKNTHHCAFSPFSGWDHEYGTYGSTKTPKNAYTAAKQAIADAQKLGKPLFFNLNIYDPHTGWYGWDQKKGPKKENSNHPSRIYTADEVPYPTWFPALSKSAQSGTTKGGTKDISIADEVVAYYNTVKRADDSVGQMLQAFDEAGLTDELIIVLVSDHGVQLPGGKTTLYNEGSLSPLFVQWPGVTQPDTVNGTHMVAAIDLLPTFCEMIGQPIPSELDGRSFVPILKGEAPVAWREFIYKQQNDRNKSRAVQTKDWLYINNHWADGETSFGSVTTGMHSWKLFLDAMDSPETPEQTKAWIERIHYRMPEELFHVASDPNCMNNLADSKPHADQLEAMRALMEREAVISGDELVLDAIRNPRDPAAQKATVDRIIASHDAQKNDPDHARDVMYDPHDGWQVIDNTLFEPFGEWGIWKADTEGASLNSNNGYETAGNSCIEFNGKQANICRITTSRMLDGSVLGQVKLEFRIPQAARKKKGKKSAPAGGAKVSDQTRLTVQYKDQDGWHPLTSITGKAILGDHTLVIEPPKGGWPDEIEIGLEANFGGAGGYIPLDAVRFTGWQEWTDHNDANLTASPISLGKRQQEVALTNSINATGLDTVELDYSFSSADFGPTDRLLVEYQSSNGWQTVEIHDYSYVLLPGSTYSGRVTFKANEHELGANFSVRFRSETQSSRKSIHLEEIKLRSRQSVLK